MGTNDGSVADGSQPHALRLENMMPLADFEAKCVACGLRAERLAMPDETLRRVREAQWPWLSAAWWLCGIWDSFVLYRLSASESRPAPCMR